jgi:hypothetical protein
VFLQWETAPSREATPEPSLQKAKKCIGSKTEACLARREVLEFSRKMQSVMVRDIPPMGKLKESVPGIRRIVSLDDRDAVPSGLRFVDAKPPESRQAQFQGGKRLIARIAKLVVQVHADPRIRTRFKLDADFLFFNGVPGPRSCGAGTKPNPCGGEKDTKKRAALRTWFQGDSIVAREIGRSKSEERGSESPRNFRLSAACGHGRERRKCSRDCGCFRGHEFLF